MLTLHISLVSTARRKKQLTSEYRSPRMPQRTARSSEADAKQLVFVGNTNVSHRLVRCCVVMALLASGLQQTLQADGPDALYVFSTEEHTLSTATLFTPYGYMGETSRISVSLARRRHKMPSDEPAGAR